MSSDSWRHCACQPRTNSVFAALAFKLPIVNLSFLWLTWPGALRAAPRRSVYVTTTACLIPPPSPTALLTYCSAPSAGTHHNRTVRLGVSRRHWRCGLAVQPLCTAARFRSSLLRSFRYHYVSLVVGFA